MIFGFVIAMTVVVGFLYAIAPLRDAKRAVRASEARVALKELAIPKAELWPGEEVVSRGGWNRRQEVQVWTPEERAAGFGDVYYDNEDFIRRTQTEINEWEWARVVSDMQAPTVSYLTGDHRVIRIELER